MSGDAVKLRGAAFDAAEKVENKLLSAQAGLRDLTVSPGGEVRTWAHGKAPHAFRNWIVGTYSAAASAQMIAEDLLSVEAFRRAHS